MRKRRFAPAVWCLALLMVPALAHAHPGDSDGSLMTGLMHPVFGPDHLLAMISVGVVSVQLGGHNIWRIPSAFVGAMVVGGLLGIEQLALPCMELGIAASVLVLGMGIAFPHRLSPWPITAVVAFFGALHGYAHGVEIPNSVSPALYTMGFLISTSVLHIFGMLIGEIASMQRWLWTGLRVSGGAVTVAGVAFLMQSLSGPV